MKRGFSLPEVLIALFILSTTMFILSELQVRSMLRVWQKREDIDRLYGVKEGAYKLFMQPKKVRKNTQTFEEPPMKVVVEPRAFHKKSSLAPLSNYLRLVSSTGSWEQGGRQRAISIVSMVPYQSKEHDE